MTVTFSDKAYQPLIREPLKKARQVMKQFYGTNEYEGWSISTTPGKVNHVKKGPIRYVFVEVSSPPPSLDKLSRKLSEKGTRRRHLGAVYE